jgi:RNA polymerase sigma-70 factor (ECF subfamily)
MADSVPRNKHGKKSQDTFIKGILDNDPKVIRLLYKIQFDKIKSMVQNFNYLNLDAEDVFQEGLTRAIINVRKGSFKGDSSFPTYLYSICNNICLKEYNKGKKIQLATALDPAEEKGEDNFELLNLILDAKDGLDDKCRKIIELRFGLEGNEENVRFEQVAEVLEITAANARQRFGRCFAKLMEMLHQNKEFNLLTR